MDTPSDIRMKEYTSAKSGKFKAFIQGDLEASGRTVFLTVHDLGTNVRTWYPFVMHQSMTEVRLRSVFIHICVPGQEDNSEMIPITAPFPTLDEFGEELSIVLDDLNVKTVIGVGDGAGSNIIARFAMHHPNRCMGVILIHPTSTTAGVLEWVSNKMMGRKLSTTGKTQPVYDYLVEHKFGTSQQSEAVQSYLDDLQSRINAMNLARFFDSFLKRTDLSKLLAEELKVEALVVVGSRQSHLHTVRTTFESMSKKGAQLLEVENVGDVLSESPQRLARALILFCKGQGVLSGVGIPGMEKQRTLSSSMEEADKPVRRTSIPKA